MAQRVLNDDEINSLLGLDDSCGDGKEPSMEEILASIRRILSEEDPPTPPSLWQRLRRTLFPGRRILEAMAQQLDRIHHDIDRIQRRLAKARVLTEKDIEDLLSGNDEPSPYAVRRELERLRRLLTDIGTERFADLAVALRAEGQVALLDDAILLAALEGDATMRRWLAEGLAVEAALLPRASNSG